MPKVQIESAVFGNADLPVIAGPCVIESREHALRMAEAIAGILARLKLPYIFKSSYDKANRTSRDAFRGPGPEQGLKILAEIRSELGLPVLTDVHQPDQVAAAAEVVDVLQIPAFLSRQTDLLEAAARSGRPVNVKKGQFLAPWDMRHVLAKLEAAGCRRILVTERGTQFGYNNLVADLRSIPLMQAYGWPVIFDATHSAQLPGSGPESSGGLRETIPAVARAAVAAGCDGVFLEVHDDVRRARSDAATQWPLDRLEELLRSLQRIREALVHA